MNKRTVINILFLLAVATAVLFVFIYVSKSHDFNDLKRQNSNLNAQNSNLQKQSSSLTGRLNQADSTINRLSTSGSFAAGAACQSQQLSFSEENDSQHSPGGAAGTVGQLFSYQNTSKTTCTVQGYPGFLALDNKGYVVPNGPIQTGLLGLTTKLISLDPNAKAYFVVSWNHTDPAPNQKCINPSLLESTPPKSVTPLVLTTDGTQEICSYNLSISALGQLNDF